MRRIEEHRNFKKRERGAVRQYNKGYRRFPETEPDPDEWTDVYKEWLAGHAKGQ